MTFPTPPAIDIPRWCFDGGTYTEPPLTNRQIGWAAVPGQNYAQPPPYQWVNWLSYSTGEWINYVAAYAIPYLQNGNFDNGISIFNNNSAKFYNAANDKYTSIRSSNSQTSSGIDLVLPPSLPSSPLPLVGNGAGNLNFSTISSSAVTGITSGSAPISGQVGEFLVQNGRITSPLVNTITAFTSVIALQGIWKLSLGIVLRYGTPLQFFAAINTTVSVSGTPGYNEIACQSPALSPSSGFETTLNISDYYVNLSIPTTIYCAYYFPYISPSTSFDFSFRLQRIA